MISQCDIADPIEWVTEDLPDEGHQARTFLQGERSLAAIRKDEELQQLLDRFLSSAEEQPLLVSMALTGEIRVRSSSSSQSLLLDGRTAEVLAATLRGEQSSAQDRMDMTVRGRRREE